jgi:sterol desaturase/sphingolipid hydroxylase (fatty acid hydroxylase superfamily)
LPDSQHSFAPACNILQDRSTIDVSQKISPTNQTVVALAICAYVFAILAEYMIARALGRRTHRFADTITNLACGATHQLVNVYYFLVVTCGYEFIRNRFSIVPIEEFSVGAGVVLLLLMDFSYYLEHRLLHAHPTFWAAHAVHHQSSEFNLTVSLRVSVLQVWMTTLTALPFAIIGFSPSVVLTAIVISKSYQFLLHTQLVGKLGVLEWVLMTPSHHRVHHGWNERYVDKNFGGILVVWDRIFGTFEPEAEAASYGLTERAPAPFNALLANIQPWRSAQRRDDVGAMRCVAPTTWTFATRASGVMRLAAVFALVISVLLSDSTYVRYWLLSLPPTLLWLWQLGSLLDGHRVRRTADAASVVLAITGGAVLACSQVAPPLLTGTLFGTAFLVALASLVNRHAPGRADCVGAT